jgi:hypothetical protein
MVRCRARFLNLTEERKGLKGWGKEEKLTKTRKG